MYERGEEEDKEEDGGEGEGEGEEGEGEGEGTTRIMRHVHHFTPSSSERYVNLDFHHLHVFYITEQSFCKAVTHTHPGLVFCSSSTCIIVLIISSCLNSVSLE